MGIAESNLQIAIGKLAQTDYLTSTAVTVSPAVLAYIELVMSSRNFIKKDVPKQTNKGYSTGQRIATEAWNAGRHLTSFSMPFDMTFQNIGTALLAAMGATTPSASGTLFKNLFKLLDTRISQQLPAFTIIEHAAPSNGGLNVKAPSMVAKSLKMSGDGAAKAKAVVDWVGSGEYVQPSGITWATHVQSIQGTQVPIYNTTAKLVRSDAPGGGNAVNKALCENLGWEIGVTNTFAEDDYGCVRLFDPTDVSKGILASQMLLVDTEISSKFKFKLAQNSTEMALLENNAPLKLLFALLSTQTETAASHKLAFDMPLNKYKVLDHSAENGFVYLTMEPETLYSVDAGKALEVELITDVQAYT